MTGADDEPYINSTVGYSGNVRTADWDPGNPDEVIDAIVSEFENGKPVIIPTDTLYGISAPVFNEEALKEIFLMKQRPERVTLPVAVGSIESIGDIAEVSGSQMDLIREKLPGPYTFILNAREILPLEVTRDRKVAVRVPDHSLFHNLCGRSGPLALTSANIHGRPPVISHEEAEEQFHRYDVLMVTDTENPSGTPSEIHDITGIVPLLIR